MLMCPRCSAVEFVIDGEWSVCGSCGFRAATAYVAELVWLQDQQRVLGARLTWVSDRVAAGDPPAPRGHPPARARSGGLTGQQLLLGTGGLLLVIAATVFLAVNWRGLGVAAQVCSVLVAVAAAAGTSQTLRRTSPATASTLAAVASGVLGVALAASPRLLATDPYTPTFDRPAWYAVAGLVTAAVSAIAWRRTADPGYARAGLVALSLASTAAAVWLATHLTDTGVLVIATTVTAVLAVLAIRLGRARWWIIGSAAVGPGVLTMVVLPVTYLEHTAPWTVAALLVGVAAGLVVADRSGVVGGVGLLVPVALASAGLGALPGSRTAVVAGVLLAAAGLAIVLARRGGLALAAASPMAIGSLGVFLVLDPAPGDAAVVWGCTTLGLLLTALASGLRLAAPAAAVTGWLAAATLVDARGWVLDAEQLGLFAAIPAFLAAGAWSRASRSALPSIPVWAPGLSLLVLPSALASGVTEPVAARTAGVLAAAVLLVGLGVRLRLAAPILVGSVAALVVAAEQAASLVDLLPRWVSLLLAGAALLAAGVRLERLRSLGAASHLRFTALR